MKTAFVTGAEGFTGHRLVEFLRSRNIEVVGGVRNRARKLAFEKQFGKGLVCDVSDPINVARAIASVNPDGIFHLAGTAQAYRAGSDPLAAFQSICAGWANVLDAVRRSCPRARVVLVSACDVYGATGNDEEFLSEGSPLAPTSLFGSFKAAAEAVAHSFFSSFHLNFSIVRPFQVVGPGQPKEFFFGSVAQRIVESDGGSLQLPDLNCTRDILHVDDVIEACWAVFENGRPNDVYNVCSGTPTTIRDACERMARFAGVDVRFSALDTNDERQVRRFCGSADKLRNELGWQPRRSVDDALQQLVEGCAAPVAS